MRALVMTGLLAFSIATAVYAQPASSPARAVADAQWLVGHWAGTTASGGFVEEFWTGERDGLMTGLFRWQMSGQRWLFELLTLDAREPGDTLTLRLKHFDRLLNGQEEKHESTTLRLVERTADRLIFETKEGDATVRVGYVRRGDDALLATFERTQPGKPGTYIDFPYRRVP